MERDKEETMKIRSDYIETFKSSWAHRINISSELKRYMRCLIKQKSHCRRLKRNSNRPIWNIETYSRQWKFAERGVRKTCLATKETAKTWILKLNSITKSSLSQQQKKGLNGYSIEVNIDVPTASNLLQMAKNFQPRSGL